MGQPTYTAEVIVLRKTKLGESDLILTCLTDDGSQLRVVAKGARKPTSTFSSRLELFSHARLLCARGRSLDIVKEAKLLDGFDALRTFPERTAAASILCEFIGKVSQDGLEVPRLSAMVLAALREMNVAPANALEGLAAASVLKGLAFCGLRPELATCIGCGAPLDPSRSQGDMTWFSYTEGGVVCDDCAHGLDCVALDTPLVQWLHVLLYSPFSDIAGMETARVSFACLQVCQQWCRVHIGSPLKSIDFVLVNPMATEV